MTQTVESYQTAVQQTVLAAQLLAEHDIPGLLSAIDRAETVAPFTDPTLYMKKSKAMREDKEVLQAALPLYELGKKIKAAAARKTWPTPEPNQVWTDPAGRKIVLKTVQAQELRALRGRDPALAGWEYVCERPHGETDGEGRDQPDFSYLCRSQYGCRCQA